MRSHRLIRRFPASVLVLATVAGCTAAPSPLPSAASVSPAPASERPSSTQAPGVVVTFRVAGQQTYRVQLTDPADIALAQAWREGARGPLIPNGRIVRGDDGGVNTGYSWHIDPNDVEFAELSIEACDGLPSHVEDGTLTGDRYCPWSAEIVSIEPFGG